MTSYGLPPITSLPPIATLPTLPTDTRAAILDALFEPSTALHTLSLSLLKENAYASYDALIADVGKQLSALLASPSTSDDKWLLEILAAHPRLGAKRDGLTDASKAEQAHLQSGGEEEARVLQELNAQYEETFPGLIYLVFVNGRSRAEIFEDMRARIARNDITEEKKAEIEAMCQVASDRAKKLQSA